MERAAKRAVAVGVLALGALGSTTAAALGQTSTSPSPEPPVTFTVGVIGDLNSVNPFRGLDTYEAFVTGLMYDGLVRLAQKDYAAEPELAERWETSPDGLTWTFVLKEGLTWSDGEPITAADFAWTGNFIVNHDISSWSDGYTYTDSIVATDDRTIVWTTTKPTLIPGLPGYNLLLPEHVWGGFTEKELKRFRNFPDPVVSGPFNLVEWVQGEYWRMEANPSYWGDRPHIDEIVFRLYNSSESVVQALLKGAIDYTQIPTAALFESIRDQPGIATAIDSAEAFYQLSFNLADDPKSSVHPALLDVRVRDAISRAIDRETLIDRVLRGYATPGTTPIVPLYESWHWEPPPEEAHAFDPAEANGILDDAGYLDTDGDGVREMPGGGRPLEVRLYDAVDDPDAVRAAPFIQGWLRDIGIAATITSMTDLKLFNVWVYDLDWDMLIYSWGTGPDPDFLLSSFTTHQCGYWSDTCYSNPVYDAMYLEQQTTLDRARRREIVAEMQRIIYRDTPEIILWYPNSFEAWRGDRWTGFERWPEPDGVAFWGNFYSARSVRPIGSIVQGGAEDGPAGWVWLIGAAAALVAIAGSARHRRRLDTYYA
jgi:peptide/nickel transport system substrate-binding protein